MEASKREQLYEGKAKKIYATDQEQLVWVEYKDDATAFNGEKKGQIAAKGIYNNQISTIFFNLLHEHGIPTHFVKAISEREQLVKHVTIIPIEVVVRNIVAGSLAKRLGYEEGKALKQPIVELYYKDDSLGDPFINDEHVAVLNLTTAERLDEMKQMARKINELLSDYLLAKGLLLVDFKLEFGIDASGKLLLADEISPDTCRLWDVETQRKLDKDRFRRDLGDVEEAYHEVLQRLGGTTNV